MGKRADADVYPFLEDLIARKEQQIADILQLVERYEKQRLMEERSYQAMSPLRRMLNGKKPGHHVAVEYIHYVKKPMEQVGRLRREVESAKAILDQMKPVDLEKLPDEPENGLKH